MGMSTLRIKLLATAALVVVGIPCAECFSRAPAPSGFWSGNRRWDVGPRAEQQEQAPAKEPIQIAIEGEEINHEADELVDALTAKLGEMEGLWYSDDFYGPHGREWVKVSATLVGEAAARALVAVKVTGDPNVPAGCVTFKTGSWPNVGGKVAAEIHVRADPNDPDGFSWLPGELTLVAKDQMELVVRYSFLMSGGGTFYKKDDEESGE